MIILFDQLATAALINDAGSIDQLRYPSFYELSRSAYWFKNATYPPQNHPLRSNFENFFKSKLINNNVGQLIIDNTGKFKSNELSEFNWLYKCLTKDNSIYVAKNVDIFFIKNNCIK